MRQLKKTNLYYIAKKQETWLLISFENVNQLSKYFYCRIPNESIWVCERDFHLTSTVLLHASPYEIRKFKITSELLFLASQFICLIGHHVGQWPTFLVFFLNIMHKDLKSCLSRTYLFYSITLQCWTWKQLIDIGKKFFKKFPEIFGNIGTNFWKFCAGNFRTHNSSRPISKFFQREPWP